MLNAKSITPESLQHAAVSETRHLRSDQGQESWSNTAAAVSLCATFQKTTRSRVTTHL